MLISAGLVNQISDLGWHVHYRTQQDFLDTPYTAIAPGASDTTREVLPDEDIGKMKKPRLVSAVTSKVADRVGEIAEKGWMPLTLGGDHSLVSGFLNCGLLTSGPETHVQGLGTVMGTKKKYPDARVIWVDAHADINTPNTTDTGNLHGCPVSFLMGLEGCDVEPFNKWVKPCLKPHELCVSSTCLITSLFVLWTVD